MFARSASVYLSSLSNLSNVPLGHCSRAHVGCTSTRPLRSDARIGAARPRMSLEGVPISLGMGTRLVLSDPRIKRIIYVVARTSIKKETHTVDSFVFELDGQPASHITVGKSGRP